MFNFCMDCAYLSVNRVNGLGENSNFSSQLRTKCIVRHRSFTYWENSCSFGLRYVSWYKYLIVSLVFSHLGFWSGNLFLIAPFPDLCLLVPLYVNNTTCLSAVICRVYKHKDLNCLELSSKLCHVTSSRGGLSGRSQNSLPT